jgi:PAS domain S-box-containing protein
MTPSFQGEHSAEILLRALMHNVPGAIYRCKPDDDWSMAIIGDEIERIAGYPASDFTGGVRTFASVIHPDDREYVRREVDTAVSAERPFSLEYRIVTSRGEERWVHERGQRTFDGGEEWLDGLIFDITDRRQSEQALRNQTRDAARAAEVEASRARIVAASDTARRRLERDLHDGAQQRLVSAVLTLRMVRSALENDDPIATDLLDRAQRDVEGGLTELRELAQGIHPAMLTEQGLVPAIEALAARSTLHVAVSGALSARPRPAVESALYFTVAEALTNCAKYADARTVEVTVSEPDGEVEVAVTDDGCGGADADSGSGLRGIADRIAALGGTLVVSSPSGQGTAVRARVPR